MSKNLFAGVDIGGTKLHAVIATNTGEVIARARKKTKDRKFEAVIQRLTKVVGEACKEADCAVEQLAAVGVGAPSPILDDGTAINAPNLGWQNVPLVPRLTSALGRPVFAANDCDAGTFGEHVFGAAQQARAVVGLFIGTGLGGGIILDGQIINGVNNKAAEIGHMVVQVGGRRCGCGRRGCLEAYASKVGIGRFLARAVYCDERQTLLTELAQGDFRNVRSRLLARAYNDEDAVTVEALHEAADYLGYGVGNMITLLGPDVVVLGGGVFEALGDVLIDRVRKAAKQASWPPTSFDDTAIRQAALGDDAVALGALAWARAGLRDR